MSTEAELSAVITAAKPNGENDTIVLNNNITLNSFLVPLGDTSGDNLIANLNGNTISGSNAMRV